MLKNLHIWLPGYLKRSLHFSCSVQRAACSVDAPRTTHHAPRNSILSAKHVIFCIADHFEPRWGKVGEEKELERVERWIKGYSAVMSKHKDAETNPPRYSFFYPVDEFTPAVFEKIAQFCKQGRGEVEIQLHHDGDTADSLKKKLEEAKNTFSRYGALSRNKSDHTVRYGFIHGNWALDNSRSDGRWCGVSNELGVLKETGCYADFTLPSAPSETQTKKINSIYYAQDTPEPKSHNTGRDVEVLRLLRPLARPRNDEVGARPRDGSCRDRFETCPYKDTMVPKELMLIQGPLALNWRRRKFGILPRIENAEISLENPPTKDRVDLWVKQEISVRGKADWIFVKVHAHGAKDEHLAAGYFRRLDEMFSYLENKYNDSQDYVLHYVTARQMYNMVKAAEAGEIGEPGQYRDYELVMC